MWLGVKDVGGKNRRESFAVGCCGGHVSPFALESPSVAYVYLISEIK